MHTGRILLGYGVRMYCRNFNIIITAIGFSIMKILKLPRRSFILALALFGFVQHFTGSAQAQSPSGDLTITVQELENNEVRFTVAGSAAMKREGGFGSTSYDSTAVTPPHTQSGSSQLPLPPASS